MRTAAVVLALLIVPFAAPAQAGPTAAAKCAIAKSKAAAKRVASELKCWHKAFSASAETPDPECLTKAADKFSAAITKAEASGGCLVEGDTVVLGSTSETCVDNILSLVPPGSGACFAGATVDVISGPGFLFNGQMGLAGADARCDATVEAGSHMCSYSELLAAGLADEFSGISDATTFWLERDVTVDVGGIPSPPGQGGNCVDWQSVGEHNTDGEYVTFSGGVPTYHFDNDTYYDGIDTTHTIPGDLQCSASRSIPCCSSCAP